MTSVSVKEDLYQAVNGQWEETAQIPADKAATGGFADLRDGVEATMKQDLAAMAAGRAQTPAVLTTALTYYKKAVDFDAREQAGFAPLARRLATIAGVPDFAAFNQKAAVWAKETLPLPFDFGIGPDMKDTETYLVELTGPDTILPDTTYYQKANRNGAKLLKVWADMAQELLTYTDLDATEQKRYLADALAFDASIAGKVKSRLQWANRVDAYHPASLSAVSEKFGAFDFTAFISAVLPQTPTRVNAADPHFLDEFTNLFEPEHFTSFKHWAYVRELVKDTAFLSQKLQTIGARYQQARSGALKQSAPETLAYQLTDRYFSEPLGVYYGRKYFGEAAKADVTKLVEQLIATYQRRLKASPWLSDSTKVKAGAKLAAMKLNMGYPDSVHPFYTSQTVSAEADLLTASLTLNAQRQAFVLNQFGKPVDRTRWAMPGHMVNACYRSSWNDITFPAAILQAPFYSLKQTPSQNFGGIGAVIGHEISHGFDNNGAQFDAKGNLSNWWQPADYAHFKDLTQQMIARFDGQKTPAGPVNGKLVVSENIADCGGLAAALDTCQHLDQPDLKAFFLNWARIWRQKTRLERQQLLLATDVHAPHQLRTNLQVQNLDEFFETFDIKPDDGMYLAPEKRLHIW